MNALVGWALSCASFALSVGAIELACRFLEVDFSNGLYYNYPIFYRKPNVPSGEAFFRRPGPEAWTGRVLATGLRMEGSRERAYEDEPVITVEYSSEGFRNPEVLSDWDLVVAGDSFTELGALPYDQLFTTLVGQQLGLRVKNLGVCYTATPGEVHFLRTYGKAASTRRALLVWYEGNDLVETGSELKRLEEARSKGVQPEMPTKQTSFLAALAGLWKMLTLPEVKYTNAYFAAGTTEFPVSIYCSPPSAATLTEEERANVQATFAGYAAACAELGLEPWLAFMPCKHRALQGHLRFVPVEADSYEVAHGYAEEVRAWEGSDLPQYIGDCAQQHGIRFVDLTPALRACAERGELAYNGVLDTHLNRLGSQVVAEELARALREAPRPEAQANR